MSHQLEEHHKLISDIATKNKGWIVKTIGDAFMVYFSTSEDSLFNALKCSKEIIKSESKYNLRIGVCEGQMDHKTYKIQNANLKDFFGNVVNVASRMESKVSTQGSIAFTSTKSIDDRISNYKSIGELVKIDLSKYDLRGASAKEAYTIRIK
jgi:class 3 adenylate cyclase